MIDLTRFTLSNGLRVVHHHNSATAMVALDILYDVGSRDEEPELTGMAHLFEHLMFGGSANIPDFDKELERAGGTNNAWTNCDFTNFYDVVPGHNAATAFWLEADRMEALAFSDKALEVQRSVVTEEFKQVCLNQPYGDLQHHLNALAYKVHPYRTPVIGREPSHIARVTNSDVRRFFHSHYAPGNAVLAVTGNLDAAQVRDLCEEWFGPVTPRAVAPRTYAQEPPQTAPRRAVTEGRVPQTVITKAFHMPGYGKPGYFACDTITDLLSAGYSSRFYRRLMLGTDLFTRCDAAITGTVEPGLLLLSAYLRPGVEEERAEDAMTRCALSLVSEPPTPHELERTLNNVEATHTFQCMNYVSLASMLAQCEMLGSDINSYMAERRAVGIDGIVAAAESTLTPENSSTLIYRSLSDD